MIGHEEELGEMMTRVNEAVNVRKGATSERWRAGHAHQKRWCGEAYPGRKGKGPGSTIKKMLGYPLFSNGVARH